MLNFAPNADREIWRIYQKLIKTRYVKCSCNGADCNDTHISYIELHLGFHHETSQKSARHYGN